MSWGSTGPCPPTPSPLRKSARSSWTWGRCTPPTRRCRCCCECANSSTPSCRTTLVSRTTVCGFLLRSPADLWPFPCFSSQGGCTGPTTSCPCWPTLWLSATCHSWTPRFSTWWSCWTRRCCREKVGSDRLCRDPAEIKSDLICWLPSVQAIKCLFFYLKRILINCFIFPAFSKNW